MDKTYAKLVAARDNALKTVAGVLTTESTDGDMTAVAAFCQSVSAAKTAMECMTLATAIPAVVPMPLAMAALTAHIGVLGYTPSTDGKRERKLTVKTNKSGGLFVALTGGFNLNFHGGVYSLMELETHLPAIKQALAEMVDGKTPTTVGKSIDKGKGVTQIKSVAMAGDLMLGPPEVADDVLLWVAGE